MSPSACDGTTVVAENTTPHDAETILQHPAVQRVRTALVHAGAEQAANTIVVLDAHAHTAASAAAQLGCEVSHIANSLIFSLPATDPGAEPEPLLVMTSGAHRVDTALLAVQLGAPKLDRANADFVRQHTSFAIGGVAPTGHPHPVRTVVDVALADYSQIWAAAGHPRTVFATTYDELVQITSGTPASVA